MSPWHTTCRRHETKWQQPIPCLLWLRRAVFRCGQVLAGRSHALLQETGVNLVDIIREEGFYVRQRRTSAPAKGRREGTFGSALPIELPTEPEMDRAAQQCVHRRPCHCSADPWLSHRSAEQRRRDAISTLSNSDEAASTVDQVPSIPNVARKHGRVEWQLLYSMPV